MCYENNPWTKIDLQDYERHMGHPEVHQLQELAAITREQLCLIPAEQRPGAKAAILGIAGGNGLLHPEAAEYRRITGLDINASFLQSCREHLPQLRHNLSLEVIDLTQETERAASLLDGFDLLTANLLIEHIHLSRFMRLLHKMRRKPAVVSCVIQINEDGGRVSASGYEAAFVPLSSVIEEADPDAICSEMMSIGYACTLNRLVSLPNKKQLNRLDFRL